MLVALEDITLQMGPTECARGSHRLTNHLRNPNLVLEELIYQHANTSPLTLVEGVAAGTVAAVESTVSTADTPKPGPNTAAVNATAANTVAHTVEDTAETITSKLGTSTSGSSGGDNTCSNDPFSDPVPVPETWTRAIPKGAALIFDDRLLHRGMANGSTKTRNVAYFSYKRRGYDETTHFEAQRSVYDD